MSWIQFQGEVWPVTAGNAELRVSVHAPDVGCPRVSWRLELFQAIEPKAPLPEGPNTERWINVELTSFTVPVRDWREFANREIRADAAWQAEQEFVGPYGHCHHLPKVEVSMTVLKQYAAKESDAGWFYWVGHDFVLRFGSRDGYAFPCELDAWLIPKEEYYRKTPETPAEAVRFAEGPPNLRVLTRAVFEGGGIDLARCGTDPLPVARNILREQAGWNELLEPQLEWHLRHTPDHKELVRMPPGWRSSVSFFTPASAYVHEMREKRKAESEG
jgi:hypothetical protein